MWKNKQLLSVQTAKRWLKKLYRGVWAVCPEADIQLYWTGMNVAYGRQAPSFDGFAMMGKSAFPLTS